LVVEYPRIAQVRIGGYRCACPWAPSFSATKSRAKESEGTTGHRKSSISRPFNLTQYFRAFFRAVPKVPRCAAATGHAVFLQAFWLDTIRSEKRQSLAAPATARSRLPWPGRGRRSRPAKGDHMYPGNFRVACSISFRSRLGATPCSICKGRRRGAACGDRRPGRERSLKDSNRAREGKRNSRALR